MMAMVAPGRQLWAPTEPQCPGEGADGLSAGPELCWGGWRGGDTACFEGRV